METNATCCLLQTMQQGFFLGRCICQKRYRICVVCIRYSLCEASSASIDMLSFIGKLNLSDKLKRNIFQAVVVFILLYGYTTWTPTKRIEKKLDGNCTRMLQVTLNKSLRQHPTKQLLYDHQPPISKTIQIRRSRHAGHCWRSKSEVISNFSYESLLYWRASVGQPSGTYLQQLCKDTGCTFEDLPDAMDNIDEW